MNPNVKAYWIAEQKPHDPESYHTFSPTYVDFTAGGVRFTVQPSCATHFVCLMDCEAWIAEFGLENSVTPKLHEFQ